MVCLCLGARRVYACFYTAGGDVQVSGPNSESATVNLTFSATHDFVDQDHYFCLPPGEPPIGPLVFYEDPLAWTHTIDDRTVVDDDGQATVVKDVDGQRWHRIMPLKGKKLGNTELRSASHDDGEYFDDDDARPGTWATTILITL
jgi:hypothetical protein